jgi:hypothetical protein
MMINEEVDKKGFVWYSIRFSFWLMVILLLIFLIMLIGIIDISLGENLTVLLIYFLPLLAIFNIIVSIIFLSEYEKKGFVIISLISSFLIIIGFIIFLLSRKIVY